MKSRQLAVCLVMVAAVPMFGNAQVYRSDTPPPRMTAAGSEWLASRQPVYFAGNYYYQAGADVFFDGKIMSQTGSFQGVPLYADVTIEPYSIVLVPIGGKWMRPYERRRSGELAGTVGSRAPSFPIERDVELSARTAGAGIDVPPPFATDSLGFGDAVAVGTAGDGRERATPQAQSAPADAVATTGRNVVQSIQRPGPIDGVWIMYEGQRWYNDGPSVGFDPGRFMAIGSYRGVPVYRDRAQTGRIFVTIAVNGRLAPFAAR